MFLDDLIESLQELSEAGYGDSEVRLMTQQNYPFEHAIRGITISDELNREDEGDARTDREEEASIVYIVEGDQLGYGNKSAWSQC